MFTGYGIPDFIFLIITGFAAVNLPNSPDLLVKTFFLEITVFIVVNLPIPIWSVLTFFSFGNHYFAHILQLEFRQNLQVSSTDHKNFTSRAAGFTSTI